MTDPNPCPRAAEYATLWCVVISIVALMVSAVLIAGCVNPYPAILKSSHGLEESFEAYAKRSVPAPGVDPEDHAGLEEDVRGELGDLQAVVEEAGK